jgi:hypothetical protein
MLNLHPIEDGTTHINIYSKGRTPLGRALSNFAHTPFVSPDYGAFQSLEGFWYWFSTGRQHDQLRTLHGYAAKKEGQRHPRVESGLFEQAICHATECKIRSHPALYVQLAQSTLPLVHYYWFGTMQNDRFQQIFSSANAFQLLFIDELRHQIQHESVDFYV